MKRIDGLTKLHTDLLESHHYVCDLMNVDVPVLSLYTDGRQNWMYLWVDTNHTRRQRLLLFTVARDLLSRYLKRATNLNAVVKAAEISWLLDESHPAPQPQHPRASRTRPRVTRRLWLVPAVNLIEQYLPTTESVFDPELAPDVDLTQELLPKEFPVPIKGEWFGRDFEYLFKRYERIYAFFYATGDRFVRTINTTLQHVMHAPWRGGYSRVNLYSRLAEVLPAQHALRVSELQYGSPGSVKFEAIPTIGHCIAKTVVKYLNDENDVDASAHLITKTLATARLNRVDLSNTPERAINMPKKDLDDVIAAAKDIASRLGVTKEMKVLRAHAPNSVVHAKAVVSFVRQVNKLAYLQRQGILNFRN